MLAKPKNKKPKSGAKNWRKNIDVSYEEKARINKLQDKLEQQISDNLKPKDLYTIDTSKQELPRGFLGRKTENLNTTKELAKRDNKLIKRTIISQEFKKEEKKELKLVEDLWADTNTKVLVPSKNQITLSVKPVIVLPKVGLPHPGLSYNPKLEDTKNLITHVLEANKQLTTGRKYRREIEERVALSNSNQANNTENQKDSSDESEIEPEQVENSTKQLTKPLTKAERNRKLRTRLNQLKNKKDFEKKQTKKEIYSIKSHKHFENVQKLNNEKIMKIKEQENLLKKKKSDLLRLGVHIE